MGSIHLVRHGQASWQSDDYDKLSDLGHRQADALGLSWEAAQFEWTHAVAGSMRRHDETAISAMEGADFGDGHDVDERWNEYDHLALTGFVDAASRPADAREFQKLLNVSLDRWIGGDTTQGESFAEFADRVRGAFDEAREHAGSGQSVVVFTSGGPIALATSYALAGDASLFQRLNNVVINASVTTFIVGSSGTNLLSFNEHTHLPKDMVTFR